MAVRLHVGYMQFRGKDSDGGCRQLSPVNHSPSRPFHDVAGLDALFTLHARPKQAETTVMH